MCLFLKFSMPFLVKPASPVKSTQLLKKGSSPYCWWNGTAGRILGMGEIKQTCSLYLLQMVWVATLHGEPATLLCTHVRLLQFNERWYSNSPLHVSECVLPHNCSWTSPSSKVYQSTILIQGWTVPVSLMWWWIAQNICGFRSLCWGYLSVHNLTAAVPVPWALSKIMCILAYSKNV